MNMIFLLSLLLSYPSAFAFRTLMRCEDLPPKFTHTVAFAACQVCGAASTSPLSSYFDNIIVTDSKDHKSWSLADIIRGKANSNVQSYNSSCFDPIGRCESFTITNQNSRLDCSNPFMIYAESNWAISVPVTNVETTQHLAYSTLASRHTIYLSPSGLFRFTTNSQTDLKAVLAGSVDGSKTLYEVNEKVPNEIVVFGSIVELVPKSYSKQFSISHSSNVHDGLVLSQGQLAVIASAAYPDAQHLTHAADNFAIFNLAAASTVSTRSVFTFDAKYQGGVELAGSGGYFNGSQIYSGQSDATGKTWSYYGDAFKLNYLTAVTSHAAQENKDLFFVEVSIKALPPGISTPASPTPSLITTSTTVSTPTTTLKPATIAQTTMNPTTYNPPVTTVLQTPSTPTTTASTPPPTTAGPYDPEQDYCKCSYNTIWLDVVFIVDSSNGMGSAGVENVVAMLQGTLYQMSLGDAAFRSRVAVIAYSANSTVISGFRQLQSPNDVDNLDIPYFGSGDTNIEAAIGDASSLLDETSRIRVSRKVIVLVGSSYKKGAYNDPNKIANGFKDSGGTIVVLDYVQQDGLADPALEDLASPNYFFTNQKGNFTPANLLEAFCQVNCFCETQLRGFALQSSRPDLPTGGCFDPVTLPTVERAARINCGRQHGFLATPHDAAKKAFLNSQFGPKTKQWLGVKYFSTNGSLIWDDGTHDSYTDWAVGEPSDAGECIFQQQYKGFTAGWFSADCMREQADYICQIRPCDSTFDCNKR